MKVAKSTRNKDNKNFNEVFQSDKKESPKRAFTKDDRGQFSNPSSYPENDDKLNISPVESDEDEGSSNKIMGNTLGFFPMNKLTQNNKYFQKNDLKSERFGKTGEPIELGRSSERKDDRKRESQFKINNNKKLQESRSATKNFNGMKTMNEYKIGDTMNLNETHSEAAWNATNEWQNEKDIGRYQSVDQGRNRRNKNSRVGSRDGSKRSKRHRNKISSVHSKRGKATKSRQGARRILHNPKKAVIFSEFKTEDEVNKEIGISEEEENKAKFDAGEIDEYELKVDEEHLNDAVSLNYTLGDRSCSFSAEGQSFVQEKEEQGNDDFIAIVDQDSYEKLEAYRDRCPCLRIRKFFMKIRLMITKSAFIIISNPLFEYASLVVIIANSIVLTLEDPTDPDSGSTGFLATLDTIFLILYTIEMMLKIIGLGFILNKGSYLRESWNILDFVIVVSAYLQLLLSSGANLSVLRSFRVLRPLKTISGIEGLRVIVSALMKAVSLLLDTVIILCFFFIIFAIGGVQLWSGVLKKRCVDEYTGVIQSNELCGSVDCKAGFFCGKTNENPNFGVTNFDNLLYSLLVVFQSVTLEGWSVIMVDVQKTFNILSLLFFIPLVFIGAFFLLNLTLVVIKSKFTEEHEANKERKKHRIHILKKMSKEDIIKQREARNAYTKLKIIHQKKTFKNRDRRDSDENIVERIRKNIKQRRNVNNADSMIMSHYGSDDPQSRAQTAKDGSRGKPKLNIFGIQSTIKKVNVGEPITEESRKAGESETGAPKERNVLYLKQGRGKLKMEGMYGISRKHDKNGNDLGSQSDLLEDIPLSIGEDNDTDGHEKEDDSQNEMAESEIMFPLDSSLTDSTKNNKKKSSTNDKDSKDKIDGVLDDKAGFSISDNSYDFDNENLNADEKAKAVERLNTNYYTSTDNGDLKGIKKNNTSLQKRSTLRKNNTNNEDKLMPGKNTKISSKIEDNEKFKTMGTLDNTSINRAVDFSLKNLINLTKKKIHDRKILEQFNKEDKEDSQSDKNQNKEFENSNDSDEEEKTPRDSKGVSILDEEELEQRSIEDIHIVKKGMKIHVKSDTKFNNPLDTPLEDILRSHRDEEENEIPNRRRRNEDDDKPKKRTNIAPYNLNRVMELNEHLLEGMEDDENEEEENNNEKEKLPKSDTLDQKDKSFDEQSEKSETNLYLEKFKFQYRSNVIATGTVSIVVSAKHPENLVDIPNPLAVTYGNVVLDDEVDSSIDDSKDNMLDNHKALRRNDTILPGAIMRQGTTVSKTLNRRTKTGGNRVFNKNNKKKVKEEEDQSNENVLKKLIMDIPETSIFYKIIDTEALKKEQQEDELLDEEDEENDEFEEIVEDDEDDLEDIFLDREIDFDLELERARASSARRKRDRTEWSGQDIKADYDPYYAKIATDQMTSIVIFPYGIFGVIVKLKSWLRDFVSSSFFDNLMTLAVAINTIVLALDHHGISEDEEKTLTDMNFYFTIIFIAEMGLKIIGLGPIAYLQDKMNYLDGMVVLLSIFELAFLSGGGALSAFRAVRIMRTFRVLRVARLLKSMQSMQTIIDVIARSVSSFLYLAMLLLLFIFIYALLGMQTYGGRFNFDDGKPRANFDSFNSAFITVFQVLTMENWQVVLYDCMRSSVNKILTALYLISWIFVGNFMLLNLFLAILLDSFAEDDLTEDSKKKTPEEIKQDNIERRNEFFKKKGEELILVYSDSVMNNSKNNKNKGGGFVKQTKKKLKNDKQLDESFELEDMAMKKKKKEIKEKKPDYWGVFCERSFYLFHYKNIIRKGCYKMTNHYLFENVVLVLIITSSIKLAYDTYILDLPSDNTQKVVSTNLDLFFTVFFIFEALVKCISLGFVQDKGSYLRESWNQLDFFIVVASIFDLAFEGVNIPAIRILRLLRTLRPLRFISHNSDMQLIVTALLESVGHIINVVVVVLMVWLMFAILAVNLFGGKLYYCDVNTYEVSNAQECRLANGKWGPYDANFDSVPDAMLTLFIVSTLEGWPDIMYQTVDGRCVECGPEIDASPLAAYFFVIFIFIGSFFFLNFFVGVIFLNYEEAQRLEKESWFMTKKELEWVDVMKMIVKAKPDLETTNEPMNKYLKKLHAVVVSKSFEIFIMICIVLNMVQMGLTYEGEPADYTLSLLIINYIFTGIFIIECILKLLAFGLTYFQSSWNVFDFIVVICSIIDILLTNMNASSLTFLRVGPQLVRVLRVLRVSRLLRLINKYPGLQALIKTITFSLPSLLSVFSLLLLIFFIFAILGVFIFNDVKRGDVIDDYVNFNNFGNAMIM